jgi:hypothetical protein
MTDSLGWRLRVAVAATSSITRVEPEFADMRPFERTIRFSRVANPDAKPADEESDIRKSTFAAMLIRGTRPAVSG